MIAELSVRSAQDFDLKRVYNLMQRDVVESAGYFV
jgi:hypothetical protein